MKKREKYIKSDLRKVDSIKDDEIDYTESPALDDSFFTKPLADWPKPKKTVTIRLDEDVISWFKSKGKGYQTRINQLLRIYMESKSH